MKFNRLFSSAVTVTLGTLTSIQLSFASPFVINDNYIGGGATDVNYTVADVIGENHLFGVSKMEVDLSAGQLSISVFSSYFNNVGQFGTDLGDLFIATTGWNPIGSAPYYDDKKSTSGTNWSYALVINHDTPGAGQVVDMLGTSGTVSLYQIPTQSLLQTANLPGSIYRADQIVRLDTTGLSPVALGSWNISDVLGDEFDKLNLNIALSNLDGLQDTIGLRWQMTCANDVIEGAANVPEPLTLALFSLGLLGGAIRKRFC